MTEFITASANQSDSLVVLITGFVIVFAVLLLLIGIIKLYATLVSSVFSSIEKKKAKKEEKAQTVASQPQVLPEAVSSDTLDPQTVAVIAAAVTAYYGGDKSVRVSSIRRAKSQRSEWATAGINENIMARRGF